METLPYLSKGRGPVSGTVLGPCFGSANLCRAGPNFGQNLDPVSNSQKSIFCDFGASRRVTILCVFFGNMLLGKCTSACKTSGDNPTVEARSRFFA